MPLRIDTSDVTFHVTGNPRPVRQFQSDEARIDKATGQPLWSVPMFVSGVGRIVDVKVPGEPKGVVRDVPVRVSGFTVNHWRMEPKGQDAREGMAYRAERIEPAAAK
jgi:hypothetical protein